MYDAIMKLSSGYDWLLFLYICQLVHAGKRNTSYFKVKQSLRELLIEAEIIDRKYGIGICNQFHTAIQYITKPIEMIINNMILSGNVFYSNICKVTTICLRNSKDSLYITQ